MRYAQGGGLTSEGRRRREQVRLEAARRSEQRVPSAAIAAELRVSERSVRRWRQAWQASGEARLASRGQAARCRLDERQLAAVIAGLLASAAAATAAFANPVPVGDGGAIPLAPAPAAVRVISTGGMGGWQVALIAVGAALAAAAAAVFLDRKLAGRRRATVTTA